MGKEQVVIEIKGDSTNLEHAIESSEQAVDNLSVANKKAVGALDKMTGGLATKFVQARAGIGSLIKGLNLTKVAVAATGIGALVLAITALVSYFTKTKRGAELLERVTASLGAVVGVLTDRLSSLGEFLLDVFTSPKKTITELGTTIQKYVTGKVRDLLDGLGLLGSAISKAFSGDFKGAMDDAGAGVGKLAEGVAGLNPLVVVGTKMAEGFQDAAEGANEAAEAAFKLKEAEQALNDSRRETIVETAKQRAEIKQLNLIAEDTTKSTEERIAAAQRAGEIERALFERRRAEAEEALRIRREQNALSESSAEDLQAEAELEAEMYNLERESLELQTTLQNKLNTLRMEQLQAQHDANVVALENINSQAAQAIENAETERELIMGTATLRDQVEADASETRKRRFKEEMGLYAEFAKESLEIVVGATANVLDIVGSLNTLFTKGEEKRARRTFAINKALGISDATIKTAQAVADALAKDATFPGSRFLAATAAGAAGAAQIATIARQQYGGGGSGDIQTPSAPSFANPTPAPLGVPNFQIPNQDAFRSYVLASDVNSVQQATQKIKDQALLLG